jgi:SAM-dependent methyltransferase
MLGKDADYFPELQTQTGWGRTLHSFATWCAPKPGWHTLDVGCGPGLLPAILTQLGCRAAGMDLDPDMYRPPKLHPHLAVADVYAPCFPLQAFDLITGSNLFFLLPDPVQALRLLRVHLVAGGHLAMLNPSEALTEAAASSFAREKGLHGIARDTLVNWARRAEQNHRWNEDETRDLYRQAGLECMACALRVGPGFARFSWGRVE